MPPAEGDGMEIKMKKNFFIIKPEGIIHIKEIFTYFKLTLKQCDMFWVDDWPQLSRKLYGHNFKWEERRFNFENLLFTETALFGRKALCVVLKCFDEELFFMSSELKNDLRKQLCKKTHGKCIYHLLNVYGIGYTEQKSEMLCIKYDYDKEDNMISEKGFFQIQRFTYVHMPDPNLGTLEKEYDYIKKYLTLRGRLSKKEFEFLIRLGK